MCHLLESHRSIGKTSCRLTMTSALLDPHPKTCPWSTFIAADGRCSCFVNHDRVPALKAIRKRSARRVESCQQVSFSASFLRFLKARVAAPLPARGFKQGGGSSSDGRDACESAVVLSFGRLRLSGAVVVVGRATALLENAQRFL